VNHAESTIHIGLQLGGRNGACAAARIRIVMKSSCIVVNLIQFIHKVLCITQGAWLNRISDQRYDWSKHSVFRKETRESTMQVSLQHRANRVGNCFCVAAVTGRVIR